MISGEALEKFKAIYKKRFGKDISDEYALESATKLLNLVKLIYKPMTEREMKMIEKRREETRE